MNAICPFTELLTPCECSKDVIVCGGDNNYNLSAVFKRLSVNLNANDKHFKQITISNTEVKELPQNVFSDIAFEKITISGASKLFRIHSRAFTASNNLIKNLLIIDTPIVNNDTDFDLFFAIRSMKTLRGLTIHNTNINRLPAYAFQPIDGSLMNLNNIEFAHSLHSIEEFAFYELENVYHLTFMNNFISYIPENAFTFKGTSNEKLIVYFNNNKLNSTSFAIGAFSHINRPFYIEFMNNNLTYLEQSIFAPVMNHELSYVGVVDCPIDCNDCKMKWLMDDREESRKHFPNIYCGSNGKTFWEMEKEESFVNCKR